MVGSSCLRLLKKKGYKNILTIDSKELDLRNQYLVNDFILKEKPYCIINAAAIVGGIIANSTSPRIFNDNMLIQNNLINSSFKK